MTTLLNLMRARLIGFDDAPLWLPDLAMIGHDTPMAKPPLRLPAPPKPARKPRRSKCKA